MDDQDIIQQEFNLWWNAKMAPCFAEMPWLSEMQLIARKNLAEAAWFACANMQFESTNH